MVTLSTLFRLVLTDYVASGKRSVPAVRARIRNLSRHFSSVPSAEDVDEYILARRREGAAPATIRNELSVLHRAFVLAERRKLLTTPIPSIGSVKVDNVRTVTATARQVRTLVGALDVLDPAVADLVRWLIWTGWRRGEAQHLTWGDFDEELGVVTLPASRSKTSRLRRVALGAQVRLLIRRRHHLRRGPYVFHREGKRIRTFCGSWHKAAQGAGCPELHPHDLRRIFCQTAIDAGVAIPVIQQIAGWRTLSMICRYGIASGEMQAAGLDRVADRIGNLG
jgi:integrase